MKYLEAMFERTYTSTITKLAELEIGANYAGLLGYDSSKYAITYCGENKWHLKKPDAEQTVTDEATTKLIHGILRKSKGQPA